MSKITQLLLLFVCLTSSASSAAVSSPKEYFKIKDAFDQAKSTLISIPAANPSSKYTEKINYECIGEKLNLMENGEKLVTIHEGQIIILSAYLKCFDDDEVEFLNFIIIQLGINKDADFVDCAKLKLQKIEPDSNLLKNFDTKSFNSSMIAFCEYLNKDESFNVIFSKSEQVLGPLDKFTCGAISKLDVIKFIINIQVVPFETREEVRILKMKEMIDILKTKVIKTADCILTNA